MDIPTVSLGSGKRGTFRTNGGTRIGRHKGETVGTDMLQFVQLKALGIFPGHCVLQGHGLLCAALTWSLFDLVPRTQLVLCLKENSRRQSSRLFLLRWAALTIAFWAECAFQEFIPFFFFLFFNSNIILVSGAHPRVRHSITY